MTVTSSGQNVPCVCYRCIHKNTFAYNIFLTCVDRSAWIRIAPPTINIGWINIYSPTINTYVSIFEKKKKRISPLTVGEKETKVTCMKTCITCDSKRCHLFFYRSIFNCQGKLRQKSIPLSLWRSLTHITSLFSIFNLIQWCQFKTKRKEIGIM